MTSSSAAEASRPPAGRLKVLFVTQWYPTAGQAVGGVFVRELAHAACLYDDVVVLHCAMEPRLAKLWQVERETDAGINEGIETYRSWYRQVPHMTYPVYLASGLAAFRQILRAGYRPDVVHAHVFEAGMLGALISRLYRGIPLLVTEHFSGFSRKSLTPLAARRARFVYRRACLAMPVSRALQRSIEDYGVNARFQVVPNVVDLSRFRRPDTAAPRAGPVRMLFAGRLEPTHVKGVPYLLRALAELRTQRADWRLDIVGGGPSQAEYERLAQELRIADRVAFHGFLPKAEVAAFMARSDFFVLPSIWEPFGAVLIEAMASGLPILATRTGGIPEIVVDEQLGILVPPGDSGALARGLAQMLESLDGFDRQAIARAAERYSFQSVGAMLHEAYERCMRK